MYMRGTGSPRELTRRLTRVSGTRQPIYSDLSYMGPACVHLSGETFAATCHTSVSVMDTV